MNTAAFCPECDSRIRLAINAEVGQQLTCEECRELLEVINLQPPELTWALDDDS